MNRTIEYGTLPAERPPWMHDRWWAVLRKRAVGLSFLETALDLEDDGFGPQDAGSVAAVERRALRHLREGGVNLRYRRDLHRTERVDRP